MKIYEYDLMNALRERPFVNQRILAEESNYSLGTVNHSLAELKRCGYLTDSYALTDKAAAEFARKAPKRAIILAAGNGLRLVPLSMEVPKALLEVKGERIIERQISQLHEAGIREICIVVGFMKEKLEYLIDKYGVELIVNPEYADKNNLHSLKYALKYLSDAYVIPCDIWCGENPFHRYELYSWYMVSDSADADSGVRVNRSMELVKTGDGAGNRMVGISYILEEDAVRIRGNVREFCRDRKYNGSFWEEALFHRDRMLISARVVPASDPVEINTYEQLRALDGGSRNLNSDVVSVISGIFNVTGDQISDIAVLKKGMTNRSFMFTCKGKKYIMRIPGEGTDQIIDRRNEAAVYRAISGKGLCDDPLYINPENGYKIVAFLDDIRTCDAENVDDLRRCMARLKEFHDMDLKVDHEFDIFGQIAFYEKLWNGQPSAYDDHAETTKNVFSLKPYIDAHAGRRSLTHIDAVPDNFLFYNRDGREELQLTDWEYAGMQDPHVDVAMFCIYSLYDRARVDRLIDIYFDNKCDRDTRIKIYCYIAACGLLWSNWCEYKRSVGVDFGEYALRQYRYAKDYFRIVKGMLEG